MDARGAQDLTQAPEGLANAHKNEAHFGALVFENSSSLSTIFNYGPYSHSQISFALFPPSLAYTKSDSPPRFYRSLFLKVAFHLFFSAQKKSAQDKGSLRRRELPSRKAHSQLKSRPSEGTGGASSKEFEVSYHPPGPSGPEVGHAGVRGHRALDGCQ